jgi:transposase
MEKSKRRELFEKACHMRPMDTDYLLVGVDIGKDKHVACFMTSSGKMLNKNWPIDNSREGFEQFLKKIRDYEQAIKPELTVVGVETTGNYMTSLANYLEDNCIFVVMVSSMVAKRNRDTLTLSWDKNDVKDARNVADCMKQGKILYYHNREEPYSDIRRLMTIYNRLSTERGHYKVRLQNNVLCITFPELTSVYPVVDELVPMTILERYPLPEDIVQLCEQKFITDIVKHSGPSVRKRKLALVYKLAQESIGSKGDGFSLRWETRFTIKKIKEIAAEQESLLKEIQELSQECPDYELLQTIPGIGPVLAGTILSEIGDVSNYRSCRQIVKLAGFDLARIQSGQFEGDVQISRRGRTALRSAAYQAALVAIRCDNALRLKYLHLERKTDAKRGEKKKLIVAIACKILRIAFAVMKHKEPYREFDKITKPEPIMV